MKSAFRRCSGKNNWVNSDDIELFLSLPALWWNNSFKVSLFVADRHTILKYVSKFVLMQCSRAPSQINYFSERSTLRDSVYFTTLKSLDYNVVMTFRFNNSNNNNNIM